MDGNIYYQGTVVEFKSLSNPGLGIQTCMLAQVHKEGWVFQIICIKGYHAGALEGLVREDPSLKGTHIAVTKEHLYSEIERNFGIIDFSTFRILH